MPCESGTASGAYKLTIGALRTLCCSSICSACQLCLVSSSWTNMHDSHPVFECSGPSKHFMVNSKLSIGCVVLHPRWQAVGHTRGLNWHVDRIAQLRSKRRLLLISKAARGSLKSNGTNSALGVGSNRRLLGSSLSGSGS